jgi:hypothetical protein
MRIPRKGSPGRRSKFQWTFLKWPRLSRLASNRITCKKNSLFSFYPDKPTSCRNRIRCSLFGRQFVLRKCPLLSRALLSFAFLIPLNDASSSFHFIAFDQSKVEVRNNKPTKARRSAAVKNGLIDSHHAIITYHF